MTVENKCHTTHIEIPNDYIDAAGVQQNIDEAVIENLRQTLQQAAYSSEQTWLEPVYVQVAQPRLTFKFTHGATIARGARIEYQVQCETGKIVSGESVVNPCGEWILDKPLPLGYHQLRVIVNTHAQCARLIITPEHCFRDVDHKTSRVWGFCIQLYTLRSERNWGMGDFTDLLRLVEYSASWGADYIGLNPLHALYPACPKSVSPYSPSSRQWLNIAYIDVDSVVEQQGTYSIREKVSSPVFQKRLQGLREQNWVDYEQVIPLKLEVLRDLFDQGAFRQNRQLFDEFCQFATQGGQALRRHACFDALQHFFYQQGLDAWGYDVWPQDYRDYHSPEVQDWLKEHPLDVDFYVYLQWIAARQLVGVQTLAKQKGMRIGLYRDLAVGASLGSSELWAEPHLYCHSLSIGAPPDPLGPLGQYWGLPPMNPIALKQLGYQPLIDLLRANMQGCGALRIDHVMGLMRLWLIEKNQPASQGAYVVYPLDDLLGILRLESHRQQCLVIGEDLGTLPENLGEKLESSGVLSYRVFLFEQAEDGGFISPKHYPKQAMAVLATHDMPTLHGWWHCEDLKLGEKLGIYHDREALQALYDARHQAKQQILNSLDGHGGLPAHIVRDVNWSPMNADLSWILHQHIAHSQCQLVGVQLEDWLGMDTPVNVPGTCDEYPNWRRKLPINLEEILAAPMIIARAQRMTQARKEVYGCH